MDENYEELLRVPAGWWAITGFLAFTFVVAVWAILDIVWALGAAVLFALLIAVVLVRYGSARITVDGQALDADGARLEWEWVRGARALDELATREALAEAANGRTWLLVRPYLKRAVRVDLGDPADIHQHWLIATRHPEELATAITAHLPADQEQTHE